MIPQSDTGHYFADTSGKMWRCTLNFPHRGRCNAFSNINHPAPPMSIGSTMWPGLAKVVEEAGEVTQIVGKLMATGGATNHFDGSDLRDRMEEELADLLAAVEFAIAHNALDADTIDERKNRKRALFEGWHVNASQRKPTGESGA